MSPAVFLASYDNRRRLVRCLIGLICCGVGFGSLVQAGLGLDPWDVFHQGVADRVGLPIGTVAILTGLVVLLCWIPLRERPGLGTVLNVLVIGSVMDLAIPRLPQPETWPGQWSMLIAAIVVAGVGVGLYIGAGLGPGPRDGLMTGIAKRRGSIRVVRTGIEFSALVVGWLLGGHVGIGTVVSAAAIGPVVHVAIERLSLPPRISLGQRTEPGAGPGLRRRSIQHPPGNHLREVDRGWGCVVGKLELEAGPLHCAVRRSVQRVGLAEQSFEMQHLEVDTGRLLHELHAETMATLVILQDVEVHERVLPEHDSVGRTESHCLAIEFPDQGVDVALLDRSGVVLFVGGSPIRRCGQARPINTDALQMLVGCTVEVRDAHVDLAEPHLSNIEVTFGRHLGS